MVRPCGEVTSKRRSNWGPQIVKRTRARRQSEQGCKKGPYRRCLCWTLRDDEKRSEIDNILAYQTAVKHKSIFKVNFETKLIEPGTIGMNMSSNNLLYLMYFPHNHTTLRSSICRFPAPHNSRPWNSRTSLEQPQHLRMDAEWPDNRCGVPDYGRGMGIVVGCDDTTAKGPGSTRVMREPRASTEESAEPQRPVADLPSDVCEAMSALREIKDQIVFENDFKTKDQRSTCEFPEKKFPLHVAQWKCDSPESEQA
uniref:Uncharacterized protein n=1 Tax=Pristionchus pacificus TaxID=54126 RepID=A0A8R1ULD4_PRIPA